MLGSKVEKSNTPPQSSPSITGKKAGAFIHYLIIKFSCVDESAFLKEFIKVSGLKFETKRKVTRKVLENHGALYGKSLTNNYSLLLTVNNGLNKVLIIPGVDCLNIFNWNALKIFLSNLPNSIISRIDIAIDINDKLGLQDINDAHRNGMFTVRGKIPNILPIGEFVNDNGIKARTLNIGQREIGKILRCYEIGKRYKLNPSTIIRLEVEFSCAKKRTISFDILVEPLHYFCGAYPYLSQFGDGYTKFTELKAKLKCHDYSSQINHAKNSYGQLFRVMMEVEGSASNVMKLLIRDGYPKGMTPDQVEPLSPQVSKNKNLNNNHQSVCKKNHGNADRLDKQQQSIFCNGIRRGPSIQPRTIRMRDAPDYLGMDKNRFNNEVRPYLIEVIYGSHGIAFDRLDLDEWWEDYKLSTGCSKSSKGDKKWDRQKLGPKASIPKPMEQKQSAKHGKESVFLVDSGELVKTKQRPGCTMKSKKGSVTSNVDKALAICLQSVQRAI
ncbi:MAG: replication initiation factor domain-containing protein [Methylotenera sp.]|nr:replication initiation factor domain-containing protein [Methylotenera sp.]